MNRAIFAFLLKMANYNLRMAGIWLDKITELPDRYDRDEVLEFIELANHAAGFEIRMRRLRMLHEENAERQERCRKVGEGQTTPVDAIH